MTEQVGPSRTSARLETWKQIGAFLGRDERTAKRWELQRGLPVHRAPGGGRSTVYAFASELESWRRRVAPEDAPPVAESLDPVETTEPDAPAGELPAIGAPKPVPTRRRWISAVMLAGVLVACAATWAWRPRPHATDRNPRADVAGARDLYLRGLAAWNARTPAGLSQGVDLFTQAIVRDPDYAPAYVGLADCYNLLRQFTSMSPAEAYPRAKAAAERAVALDEHLAGGHRSLAFVDFWWSRDVAGARREFQRALQLDPTSAQTHHWYATFLMETGDFAAARAEIDRAQALDPGSVSILADKGDILHVSGRDAEALPLLLSAAASDPDYLSPHAYLAAVYLSLRDGPRHLEQVERSAELLHDAAVASLVAAGRRGLEAGGFDAMVHAIYARDHALYVEGRTSAFDLATKAAEVGDRDRALALLQVSCARPEPQSLGLLVTREFQPLRRDPRFVALVRRVGFPAPKAA